MPWTVEREADLFAAVEAEVEVDAEVRIEASAGLQI